MQELLKKIGLFMLSIILLIGILAIIIVPFNIMSDGNNTGVIAHTYSEKGLLLGPKYYVKLDDGSGNKISKQEIYDIEVGDSYTITKTDSMKNALFAAILLLPFLLIILWVEWEIFSYLFPKTKVIQWLEMKRDNNDKQLSKIGEQVGEVVIVLFIIISFVFLIMIGKNMIFKVLPVGKNETTALVVDKEKDVSAGGKAGIIVTNTLTMYYLDHSGSAYETKKDVSSFIYDNYEMGASIPITYRTNNPYDTFIHSRSVADFISVLLRVDTIMMLLFGYLNYFFIKRYVKKIQHMRKS